MSLKINVNNKYLIIPVNRKKAPVQLYIRKESKLLYACEVYYDKLEPDFYAFKDISRYSGMDIEIELEGIAFADGIYQSDSIPEEESFYKEKLRPQFHFTPRRGWINDPNGLICKDGIWHLFFQHYPYGSSPGWGYMHWGHAVSKDLLHWEEGDIVLNPSEFGPAWSGSAVEDFNNVSGLGKNALLCYYTAAGSMSRQSAGAGGTQRLIYSNDDGKTFTEYSGNPVISSCHKYSDKFPANMNLNLDRDPKVIYHKESGKWIMLLYQGLPIAGEYDEKADPRLAHTISFYGSNNLLDWTFLSNLAGFYECPDMLDFKAENGETIWVLFGADATYSIGFFDGVRFQPFKHEKQKVWYGRFYAAQTWFNAPDDRKVQIAWANGISLDGMPFSQQQTFPVDLSLIKENGSYIMTALPVREIEALRVRSECFSFKASDSSCLSSFKAELMDIELVISGVDGGTATLVIGTHEVICDINQKTLTCNKVTAPLHLEDGKLFCRILVDRASFEIFEGHGRTAMSVYAPSSETERSLRFESSEGNLQLDMTVHVLKSIWE